jgi:hypothetical protein
MPTPSDDADAESALISSIALTSDGIEKHHITNTTCVPIDDVARRRLSPAGSIQRRELGAFNSINTTIEIAIELFAPAETSATLGQAVVAAIDDSISAGTFFTTLLSFASALNVTYFDFATVKDAYLIREPQEPMLGFLDAEVVVILATSVAVGSIGATAASSTVPAGDPLSLVFAIQFVSLTSMVDGLPSKYVDDYAGNFGWCVILRLDISQSQNNFEGLPCPPLSQGKPSK